MKLKYKTFGKGEPLIILHGLFGTLDNWQTVAKQLAKRYMVFIVDQRNHGRSPHVDEINYPAMADDLKVFMEEQWIYKANILGHSMGGKTAMQLALTYPEMLKKLIVVDIAPKDYVGNHQVIFDALFSLDLKNIKNRKHADELLQKTIKDFSIRQFLLKNLSLNKAGTYQWKMNLPVIYKDYSKILNNVIVDEAVDVPTLFIKGAKSDYIQKEDFNFIKTIFPSAQLAVIEGAGHWVHAEKPKALIKLVEAFLES